MMARHGWGDDRLPFLRAFLSFVLPNGTPEQLKSLIELVRVSSIVDRNRSLADIDIVDLLPKVSVPTMVFHCMRDRLVPFELGRRLATSIPNARFVALESENHALLSDEPACPVASLRHGFGVAEIAHV